MIVHVNVFKLPVCSAEAGRDAVAGGDQGADFADPGENTMLLRCQPSLHIHAAENV